MRRFFNDEHPHCEVISGATFISQHQVKGEGIAHMQLFYVGERQLSASRVPDVEAGREHDAGIGQQYLAYGGLCADKGIGCV